MVSFARRRRLVVAVTLSLVALGSPGSIQAQNDTDRELLDVIAVVPRDFPPHYSVDENGRPTGFAIDVMDEIAALAGVRVTYQIEDSWARVNEVLLDGRADLIPNMGITPERQDRFDYTASVETSPISIFVRRPTQDIQSETDLTGHTVAVVESNVAVSLLADRPDVELIVYNGIPNALFALLSGKVDAVVYPQPVMLEAAESIRVENRIKIVGEPMIEIKRGIAVRKGNPELLARLNEAVNLFVDTAEYRQIYVKWYGKPHPFWTPVRVGWAMGGLFLLVLVAMAIWRHITLLRLNRQLGRNIAERERSEEALRSSKKQFETAITRAPIPMVITDVHQDIVLFNDKFTELFGYTLEDVSTAERWWSAAYPEEAYRRTVQDSWEHAIALSAESGKEIEMQEWDLSTKDGSVRRVEFKMTLLGEISLIALNDVTERKQAEETLREKTQLVKEIVDSAQEGIVVFGLDRRYEIWNPFMERLTGRPASEVLGHHPSDLFPFLQDGRVIEQIERALKGETMGAIDVPYSFPDGRAGWTSDEIGPLRDATGEIIGVIATVRDITERKQAEEQREKLQAQLNQAQKIESVGRLAGGIAHDFNNMLGVILGRTEMALDRLDPADPLHVDLHEIHDAAERSADLTRQLLAFARKQTIVPRVLDLNETVEGMLKMLRRLIGEEIDLAWMPESGAWPVRMDPTQIDQILANLCVNARDAIDGVGKVTIETGNATIDEAYCDDHPGFVPGEYVILTVSDDGHGMQKEVLDQLFEPFFTTKETGTGLGLSTVYGIVKQNDGFINVYSEPGDGSTFKIYLSRHVGNVDQVPMHGPAEPTHRGHETILLVEDEPAILKMTTTMLERQGYTLLAASTPGEAIRLAGEHVGEIHLLMTDVVMPEMNGRELAKAILSLYPEVKRLFMSGYTANVIAHRGVLDEGVNFLQKPFGVQDLAAKVRDALDGE